MIEHSSCANLQKIPAPIKIKLALPPPQNPKCHPPLKRGILWAWMFFHRKKPKIAGAHKIGAPTFGPRIAGEKRLRTWGFFPKSQLVWIQFLQNEASMNSRLFATSRIHFEGKRRLMPLRSWFGSSRSRLAMKVQTLSVMPWRIAVLRWSGTVES